MDATVNYVRDKVIIITGASGGFGALTAKTAAARGAKVVLAARGADKLQAIVDEIKAAGGKASYVVADVSKKADVDAMAKFAVDTYGRIDVLVNNAGTMPLAFFHQHEQAMSAWEQCIDICLKGTLYGICAVYDQMMAQGCGHIINLSSIYANYPAEGAAVYQACKVGIQYMSDSLRSECQGKIRVTTIKPTGVPRTGIMGGVIDQMAGASNIADLINMGNTTMEDPGRPDFHDINHIQYKDFDPQIIADAIVDAIDHPWGITISDLTVRASNDPYCL